jgi:hypothetical protein
MKQKMIRFMVMMVMSVLILAACQSESSDVATLKTDDAPRVEAAAENEGEGLDNEAMMMAFTECLREQGLDVMDPVVDADGNIGKPDFPEGVKWDEAAWEACEHHLEGFTIEKERVDMSEVVDQYVEFATCMRDKGYDIEDPTTETLDQWGTDWKNTINFDDPDAHADYEECSGETVGKGDGK